MKFTRLSLISFCVFLFSLLAGQPAEAAYLGGISFSHESPAYLAHDEYVDVSIDYKVDNPDGARIYVVPFTLGQATPYFGVSGSPVEPMGAGTASRFFHITTGEATITHIRVTMVSPDQSETFLELFVPVHYVYGPTGVFNIQMDHGQFNRLPYGRNLNIDFDYATTEAASVKIFARPFTDGSLTPGYGASGSGVMPPTGSSSQSFQFSQDADVTDIRFQVLDGTTNDLIDEIFVPYDIHWREVGIYDISFDWPDGESLHNTQNLTATFTLEHYAGEDKRVWTWCTTDGSYSPGGVYQSSVTVPTGPQTVTRFCRINTGETDVDGVQFSYGTTNDVLMGFIVPVDHHWAPHAIQNHEFSPASPAIMSNDEHLEMNFDYVTDDGGGVRIFSRPAYAGELMYGISSAGSPLYPAPSGSGSFWLTFSDGDHLASSMYFHMTNADQSVELHNQFVDGWWAWGATSTITPAGDPVPSVNAALGAVYPNPFNPQATVPVDLTKDTRVELGIYDLRGRLVQKLHDGELVAGRHLFTFSGQREASGVYFCRMKTPDGVQTRPMTLLK